MAPSRAVLLDTDIGSDIDDAVALAYLLGHPDCELVGITTVTGDVQKRAMCADAVCRAAGRDDITIRAGSSDTLGPGPGQPDVPQYEAIAGSIPARVYDGDAIDFMHSVIRERSGEVIILSIGPLTNVATLFVADPYIGTHLGGLVSMAGRYFGKEAEWNAACDPLATATVFENSPGGHVCVGLDVTQECRVNPADFRAITSPAMAPVLAMAEVWFKRAGRVTLHDPLAAALLFEPHLCEYSTGEVTATDGRTDFVERPDGRHVVARTVNADAAVAEILGRVV